MATLQTFKGKGVIKGISDIKNSEHYLYVELRVEMLYSGQILDFYITENKEHPNNYRVITNYFGNNNGAHKVGDTMQFDFNIVSDKRGNVKLKIWSVYNKAFHELEKEN
jgi:phosphoribosylpyrophosphate synthetase